MTTNPTYKSYLDTALLLLDEAAALIDQLAGARTPTRKPDGTLVTETDQAVDELLGRRIAERHPTHAVLSEERITQYDPSVRFTWVIDPIDGTTNFARGIPVWGVSIALLEWGEPVVGVVGFPLLHEVFSATKDRSATLNAQPISTASERQVDNQHFIMCCTRTARRYRVSTPLKQRILGSAAYHLLKVADGSALAAIEATPKIWDLAAALLILAEAGGVIAGLGGRLPFPVPPIPGDFRSQSFPLIAAANQDILNAVSAQVTEIGYQ